MTKIFREVVFMAEIPSDAITYNGHRYYLYSDKDFNWKEAKAYCESLGGHLVTITDENEQTIVENLLKNGASKGNYRPGGYNNNYSSWQWVTGEKFDFTNWYSGEPNNVPSNKENSLRTGRKFLETQRNDRHL